MADLPDLPKCGSKSRGLMCGSKSRCRYLTRDQCFEDKIIRLGRWIRRMVLQRNDQIRTLWQYWIRFDCNPLSSTETLDTDSEACEKPGNVVGTLVRLPESRSFITRNRSYVQEVMLETVVSVFYQKRAEFRRSFRVWFTVLKALQEEQHNLVRGAQLQPQTVSEKAKRKIDRCATRIGRLSKQKPKFEFDPSSIPLRVLRAAYDSVSSLDPEESKIVQATSQSILRTARPFRPSGMGMEIESPTKPNANSPMSKKLPLLAGFAARPALTSPTSGADLSLSRRFQCYPSEGSLPSFDCSESFDVVSMDIEASSGSYGPDPDCNESASLIRLQFVNRRPSPVSIPSSGPTQQQPTTQSCSCSPSSRQSSRSLTSPQSLSPVGRSFVSESPIRSKTWDLSPKSIFRAILDRNSSRSKSPSSKYQPSSELQHSDAEDSDTNPLCRKGSRFRSLRRLPTTTPSTPLQEASGTIS